MNTKRFIINCALLIFLALGNPAPAQQLLLDQGVRVNDIWVFPQAQRPNSYIYLPNTAKLVTDSNGQPKFSYLEYVIDGATAGSDLGGGGILHLLVEYDTPESAIQRAETELQELLGDTEATISGPLIFDKGSFFITSSILATQGQSLTGRAPVLEGNQIAIAFHLDIEKAALLSQSFKSATPDLSITFDMTFSGVSDVYDAAVSFDWQRVHAAMAASAKANLFFVGVDVKKELDYLVQNQTIKFESRGAGGATEALVNRAYERITTMLFEPVPPAKLNDSESANLTKTVTDLIKKQTGELLRSRYGGLYAGFRLRNIERTGTASLQFNHSETVDNAASIVYNLGNLYQTYGDNSDFFESKVIRPGADKKDVLLVVDGELRPEFDKLLNAVEVNFRTEHSDGTQTTANRVLTEVPDSRKPAFSFTRRPEDGDDWRTFEYQVNWSFRGGARMESPWQTTGAGIISLSAPYERVRIDVEFDADQLRSAGIRAVQLHLEYDFFERRDSKSLLIVPSSTEPAQSLEITLPKGHQNYDLEIVYTHSDGSETRRTSNSSSRFIFVDANT